MSIVASQSESIRGLQKERIISAKFISLAVVFAVAVFLRTHQLSKISYWFDESFCVKMAEFPVPEIWMRAGQDTHPPLYFVMLKGWGLVSGTSPTALRLLSSLLGVATIVGMYLFLKEAYKFRPEDHANNSDLSTNIAILAAALTTLSPLHIVWSLQVRMYVLGTALTAFSSWFLMRALLRKPTRILDWFLYTVTAIGLAYTHHFGIFTLSAQLLFSVNHLYFSRKVETRDKRNFRLKLFLVSILCLATAWSLWLPTLLNQSEKVIHNFWTSPVSWELLGNVFFQLFSADQSPFQESPPTTFYGLIILQVSILGLAILLVGRRPADQYIVMAASIPFIAAVLISLGPRSIVSARYFQFAHFFLLSAVAVLICRIPLKSLRLFAIILAVGGMATLSWMNYSNRNKFAEASRMQAAFTKFNKLRSKDEILIVSHPQIYLSIIPYLENRVGVYSIEPEGDSSFSDGAPVMQPHEYYNPNHLNQTSHGSVWTVSATRFKERQWPVRMPSDWSPAAETRFSEYYYGELVLRLYLQNQNSSVSLSSE